MEKLLNKISLTCCKWSSLNAPRSETLVSHSLLRSSLLQFSAPAPSSLLLSGVIRIGLLWEAGEKDGKVIEQNQLNRLQMVQFECPSVILLSVPLVPGFAHLLAERETGAGGQRRDFRLGNFVGWRQRAGRFAEGKVSK